MGAFGKIRERIERWEPFPFVIFAAAFILVVVVASMDLGTLWILAITAIVAAWYALETFLLRKGSADADTFSALTAIHQQLEKRESRMLRGFVIREARTKIGEALAAAGAGAAYFLSEGTVDLKSVLKMLPKNANMFDKFIAALNPPFFSALDGQSALDAIESVLADFDLVAVPHRLGIHAVQEAAKAYKPMFEQPSRPLLEFIAIRRKLKGELDYRFHYVGLLQKLNIPTLGVK